jgi:hypothetical protein
MHEYDGTGDNEQPDWNMDDPSLHGEGTDQPDDIYNRVDPTLLPPQETVYDASPEAVQNRCRDAVGYGVDELYADVISPTPSVDPEEVSDVLGHLIAEQAKIAAARYDAAGVAQQVDKLLTLEGVNSVDVVAACYAGAGIGDKRSTGILHAMLAREKELLAPQLQTQIVENPYVPRPAVTS